MLPFLATFLLRASLFAPVGGLFAVAGVGDLVAGGSAAHAALVQPEEEDEPSKEGSAKPASDDDERADREGGGEAESDDRPSDAKTEGEQAESKEADDSEPSEDGETTARGQSRPGAKKKPATHKVSTKDFKIELELDGVFVAEAMEEVALRPEVWSSFKVVKAVKHGQRVRKGDILVEFDDADIDKAIEERGLALQVGEVTLMQAEEEFPRLEKSVMLGYERAKRNHEHSVQELERFQKTMRELSEKLAAYYLKTAEQELDNAREELVQLRKMYEADELTEETEEIVLRRQEFQVEVAEFSLEYEKINHEYTMNVAIPRRSELLGAAVEESRIMYDQAIMAKSLGLSKERYQLQALREARARSVETHAKLMADRALMILRAPRDGIAYYGRCSNGRWMEVGSMESKLVPFGSVSPNSVVMTILDRLPMHVEASVGEKEFPIIKQGLRATVTPQSDPEAKIEASVERVADVPGGGNKFALQIELESEEDAPQWLMPGMTCKASITTYEAEDAVMIPAELIQTDGEDDGAKYVMVLADEGDEPVRRDLKLGKTKNKEVEVLRGLAAGDEIIKGAKDTSDDDD